MAGKVWIWKQCLFLLRNQICKSIAFRSLKNHSNFLKNLMFSLKDLCKIRSQWIFHCQTFLDWNKLKFWKSAFCKRLTFVQPIFFYLQTKIMPKNSWKITKPKYISVFWRNSQDSWLDLTKKLCNLICEKWEIMVQLGRHLFCSFTNKRPGSGKGTQKWIDSLRVYCKGKFFKNIHKLRKPA